MQFTKATRKKAKLRLGLCGVSGSGKTRSALRLATGLGGKIALIDTENHSGDLYANDFDYDTCQIQAPYSPEKYISAIKNAQAAGYNVLIIDSLTHAWSGEGGVLDMVDKVTQSSNSKNSYFAWRNVTPQHNALVEAILQSSLHIIVTMRSKAEYVITEDAKGNKAPKKIGLAPIQREGMDYEFTTVFDLWIESHLAVPSKDRTDLFKNFRDVLTEETGRQFKEWLESGVDEKQAFKDKWVSLLSHAPDMEGLKMAFIESSRTAGQLYKGDDELLNALVVAKDNRKSTLGE